MTLPPGDISNTPYMLAALDPHTLGIAVAVALFTISVQGIFFTLTTKSYPGSRQWVASIVLLALAFLALVLRGRISDLLSIIGVNYGFYLSLCLLYDGLARFHGRAGRAPVDLLNHGAALLMLCGVLYYTFADNSVNTRVVLFNSFQLFMSVRMLALLRRLGRNRQRAAQTLLGATFVSLALISLWRIDSGLNGPELTSFVRDDVGLRMMMLVELVLTSVLWFSILLMTHNRIEEELGEARSRAELDSRTDRLTRLWNRAHFEAEARREIDRATRYGHPASLLMFDIDHFKRINDHHGHLVGDVVLQEIARCATASMRSSDLLCRWGGEEFVVLMQASDHDAMKAADNLRRHIATHVIPSVGSVTISVGVSQLRSGDDLTAWMRRADDAMYRAKAAGRNRVESDGPDFTLTTPMAIRWMPGFTCGHPVLDEQHQSLIDKANSLLDLCAIHADAAALVRMDELLQETERHFRYEEGVLRKVGYPRIETHMADHARLLANARQLREEVRAGSKPVSALSSFVVRDLVFGHIAEEDLGYVSFIHGDDTNQTEEAVA